MPKHCHVGSRYQTCQSWTREVLYIDEADGAKLQIAKSLRPKAVGVCIRVLVPAQGSPYSHV